jgi:microcin C transport system permease protein
MLNYIIRRLFLIIPTLIGIVIINFIVVQGAPGGPVEQTLAKIQGTDVEATARVSGSSQGETVPGWATPGTVSPWLEPDTRAVASISRPTSGCSS